MSLYGQLDTRFRHLPSARDRLLAMVFTESGQYRMGVPPTHDLQRYVRNSPVSHAHRVSTPTMIIQGDLDYVPIQQGEEFFTALYRRGIRAEFVRYWGEGHTIESPPNNPGHVGTHLRVARRTSAALSTDADASTGRAMVLRAATVPLAATRDDVIQVIEHDEASTSDAAQPAGNLFTHAMLGVHELHRTELLRDVFVWAYERSAARYTAIQQSLGEPDPLRLRYRQARTRAASSIPSTTRVAS